jgi:MoaA/NifB/PqqE/SkfB family radical SAM enzyme
MHKLAKRIQALKNKLGAFLINRDKSLNIDFDNLIVQLGVNQSCNGKCKFCSIGKLIEERMELMPGKWMYCYLKPLYPKIALMSLTFGEATMRGENLEFGKYISENFKNITLLIETNGISFSEQWSRLAAENLFFTHFSLNAVSREEYQTGVWQGAGGKEAFDKIISNLDYHLNLLKENRLEAFNPSVSMVVNKETYHEAIDFIKLALKKKAKYACLFLDASENAVMFSGSDYSQKINSLLKTLFEIERITGDSFFINFKLFIPQDIIN